MKNTERTESRFTRGMTLATGTRYDRTGRAEADGDLYPLSVRRSKRYRWRRGTRVAAAAADDISRIERARQERWKRRRLVEPARGRTRRSPAPREAIRKVCPCPADPPAPVLVCRISAD